MRALVLSVAAVGAVACAVVVATTLPSGGPFLPTWLIWALLPGCILVHLRTVRVARFDLKKRLFDRPKPLRAAAAILVAAAFGLSMQAVLTSRGNPERRGTHYYLRNHTELIPVSRSAYRYAQRREQRLFGGIAFIFYAIGILVHLPRQAAASRVAI